MSIPRPEHPMPQWERVNWMNLNGTWEFEFDFGLSAIDRQLWNKEKLDMNILVPFCPESRLSGIAYTDFMNGVIYRRNFTITEKEMRGRTILHFGAVDYLANVYVNGKHVGSHKGGYTSFSFDITAYITEGENSIFVAVRDDVRSGQQPKGKQSGTYASQGCNYTRTTGIWQTVWLEFVPFAYVKEEEFFARYKGLTEAIINNEDIFGFCYTQLYDVEQEVNGLYTYERKEKFDINIIREINSQKAAMEKDNEIKF